MALKKFLCISTSWACLKNAAELVELIKILMVFTTLGTWSMGFVVF
jgi:hypothetical protein